MDKPGGLLLVIIVRCLGSEMEVEIRPMMADMEGAGGRAGNSFGRKYGGGRADGRRE